MTAPVVEPLWSVEDVAGYLGVPVATLYQWRYRRTGPRAHRIGRHLRYDPVKVRDWLNRQAGRLWLSLRLTDGTPKNSLKLYFELFDAVMAAAVTDKVISENPCDKVKLSQLLRGLTRAPKWVPTETEVLVQQLRYSPRQYGGFYLSEPKVGSSGTIDLDPVVGEVLTDHVGPVPAGRGRPGRHHLRGPGPAHGAGAVHYIFR